MASEPDAIEVTRTSDETNSKIQVRSNSDSSLSSTVSLLTRI